MYSKLWILVFIYIPLFGQLNKEQPDRRDSADYFNELFKENLSLRPDTAYWYAMQALKYADMLGNEKAKANALNNMGVIYKNRGKIDDALSQYLAALKIHQNLDNREGIANTRSNIANLYTIKNDYQRALVFFRQARAIFYELKNNERLVQINTSIGNVFANQDQYDSALYMYFEAMKIMEELEDFPYPDLFLNIGNIYVEQKEYNKALNSYRTAEGRAISINDNQALAKIWLNMGVVYREQKDYETALYWQLKALELAQEMDDKPLLQDVYQALATVYFRANSLTNAYFYLDLTTKLKDSLFNIQASQRMAELEALYELEQKEKEIELLKTKDQNQSLQIKYNQSVILTILLAAITLAALTLLIYLRYSQNKQARKLLELRSLEIERQKNVIEHKNKETIESIEYARSIQESMIDSVNLEKKLSDSFVFYRPKDIVSGDFYWYTRRNDFDILVLVDCTGHGVAGAFMTVIANSLIDRIVNTMGYTDPADILENLNISLKENISQNPENGVVHGMDVSIVKIYKNKRLLEYCGARRPMVICSREKMTEIKGNRISIGDALLNREQKFVSKTFEPDPQSMVYIFPDGFSDQFDHSDTTKYKVRRFKSLLGEIQYMTVADQKSRLGTEFQSWKGENEQTDDILVIGFRIA